MSANQFVTDTLAARRNDPFTRRAAVIGGSASLALLGLRTARAQETPSAGTPVADTAGTNLLFIQNAGTTRLEPGENDVHTLTMSNVLAQTLYFADRPSRLTGAVTTETFAGTFSQIFRGGDSAPNATLIGHPESGTEEEEAIVVTLLSATYDSAASTLTYEIRLLSANEIGERQFEQEPITALDTGREYSEAHLFIDDVAECIIECVALGFLAPILLAVCATCAY